MKRKENASSQKLLGAYYTPKIIAETMVSWVREECFNNVLEPSCGDGVFLECMEMSGHWPVQGIDAIEIENEAAEKVERRFAAHDNCNVVNGDFFAFYHENGQRNTYSLIIGNPPYIRYQYLTAMQRGILSEILVTHGMKENKLINAWVAFMVACVQMLADNGTIAFVIPAEILQVAFAEELRLFLARHLTTITLVTFKKLVFPEIEQEVLLFIGEKRRDYEQTSIRIYELEDLDALHGFDINAQEFQPLGHVKEKWTRYFITSEEAGLLRDLSHDKRFCQFRDLGLINVGITTGDNNFFSVTEEIAERYELESVVLPLIGRSAHAHSIFFTSEDWQHNVKAGKKAQLVYFPDSVSYQDYPEKHKEYILLGEENKINEGYKCSIRDRWYIIPSVWVPDAFFLRRNNFYPKFVLNQCNAVSTDTMHRIKFNNGVIPENALLSYYNSIAFAFTEICGRSYGGGVLEILPGEMGNIVLPKIESIDCVLRKRLLRVIDDVVRNDKDIEVALNYIDAELLVRFLKIPADLCVMCRNIWKKMQSRRLNREHAV